VSKEGGIPSGVMKAVIEDWKRSYGPTFPLYGNNTVRHDISGSVRPLLASTEIPHEKVLAERADVSKKTIQRIMNGELQFVSEEIADKLTTAMDRADVWHNEFQPYLVSC
jgi:DNA-binding XRE family transcriptional regulator